MDIFWSNANACLVISVAKLYAVLHGVDVFYAKQFVAAFFYGGLE